MALPTLEDVFPTLLGADTILGDTISLGVDGGAFVPKKAFVDYGEMLRDVETGRVTEQDIRVEISKAACPARPDADTRILLPNLPNVSFRAVNVSDLGDDWRFEVKRA